MPSRPPLAVLPLLLLLGCGGARGAAAEDPDPIEQFRAELADPAAYPVRHGLAIDDEAVRAAIRAFTEEHRPWLAGRLRASVAALEDAAPPAEPDYQALLEIEPAELTEVGEVVLMVEVLDPDVRQVVRRTLSMTLPAAMVHELTLPGDLTALWLGWLATAEPAWRRCGAEGRRLTVCADYGGLDVFAVELMDTDGLWVPVRLRWWQRRPAPGAEGGAPSWPPTEPRGAPRETGP